MNICMVGLEIGASKEGVFIGGAVNSVIRLSQGLSERHRISIVTTSPRLHDSNVALPWADVYQMPVHGKYSSIGYGFDFAIKASLQIKKLHKVEKFQIIHGHSGYPAVGLVSGTAGKLINRPSVHTLYCPVDSNGQLASLFLSQVDIVVAISENVKKSLQRIKIPLRKIKVIPPAINTAIFNPSASGKKFRENIKIEKDDNVILFVGNLTKTKGIDNLLEAMKDVVHHFPEAKLLMTSEMPHKDYEDREKQIESDILHFDIENNVVRYGIIKNMAEVMAASDVIVAPFFDTNGPSDYPLPLLEAMGVGTPAIATNVGGISEIIQNMENGILLNSNDAKSLSKAIITLFEDDTLRHKLGKNASQFILNKFSVKDIAQNMEIVYEEINK